MRDLEWRRVRVLRVVQVPSDVGPSLTAIALRIDGESGVGQVMRRDLNGGRLARGNTSKEARELDQSRMTLFLMMFCVRVRWHATSVVPPSGEFTWEVGNGLTIRFC